MDDITTHIKYIVGIVGSTVLSLMAWRYKKNAHRIDTMDNLINELSSDQRVVDVEIRTIKEDIKEIKDSLKEILRRV